MDDLKITSSYDAIEDKLIIKTEFDNRAVLQENLLDRNLTPEFGKYKGNLVHVGRIHPGDIQRLKDQGYNLLSPDPEEVNRALLYIQSNEKALLTLNGTHFAKKRVTWQ